MIRTAPVGDQPGEVLNQAPRAPPLRDGDGDAAAIDGLDPRPCQRIAHLGVREARLQKRLQFLADGAGSSRCASARAAWASSSDLRIAWERSSIFPSSGRYRSLVSTISNRPKLTAWMSSDLSMLMKPLLSPSVAYAEDDTRPSESRAMPTIRLMAN